MTGCIFCRPDDETINTVIASNTYAYVRLDNFPLSKGHAEVVPVRHVQSFFDLTETEVRSIFELAIELRGEADGYTIAINDGPAAGQTIPHMHMHVIPRHFGDVPNPRGGVRNIFPHDTYSISHPREDDKS